MEDDTVKIEKIELIPVEEILDNTEHKVEEMFLWDIVDGNPDDEIQALLIHTRNDNNEKIILKEAYLPEKKVILINDSEILVSISLLVRLCSSIGLSPVFVSSCMYSYDDSCLMVVCKE